jgi:hypothetical protein
MAGCAVIKEGECQMWAKIIYEESYIILSMDKTECPINIYIQTIAQF